MNWQLIINSAFIGGCTAALSVTLGVLAALFLRGLEGRAKGMVVVLGIIAMALPPFLVTNCWLHYLGAAGSWRAWLPLNIFSLGGAVWILVLLTWPISMLWCASALRNLDVALLENDPFVSGTGLLWKVALPMLRGSMSQAGIITFVLAVNNFSVPAILQVKVLPAETWLRFNTALDTEGALLTSLPLVLTALLLILVAPSLEWRRAGASDDGQVFRRQLGKGWFGFCGLATIVLCIASVGVPLFQLASVKRTWTEMPSAIAAAKAAIGNSFLLSAIAATIVTGIGVSISIKHLGALTRIARFTGKILWLPFLVPGVVIGIALIALFNRPGFSGFYQSSGIVLLAFALRYLVVGWNGAAHAFRTVDRDLTDAGRLEGASSGDLFRLVHWPQIGSQLAGVWYLVFLLCLWDVESIILVIPPGGQTLATTIFNLLHYGYNAQVNALCFTLLGVALAPLLIWQTLSSAARSRFRRTPP